MIKQVLFTILIVSIFIISCNNDNSSKNSHYWLKNHNSIDSNYLQKTTYIKGGIDNFLSFVNILDSFKRKNLNSFKNEDLKISRKKFIFFADSVFEKSAIKYSATHLIFDKDYIKREDIYHNNKLAYKAIYESSWKDSVSFNDFKEYILPYKLSNEIFDNWRDTLYDFHKKLVIKFPKLKNVDSLYNYHVKTGRKRLKSSRNKGSFYPVSENFTWYNLVKSGDCISRTRNTIYYLRAAGIPATFDYLVAWGNRPYARHAYVGLSFRKKMLKKIIKNNNDPSNLTNDLNAAMSIEDTYVFLKKDLPKGIYIQYEKTIPKIYRETWSEQPFIYDLLSKVPKEEICFDLIKPNMIDVTSKYIEVADAEIKKGFFEKRSIAYLGVFDMEGWRPISYSLFDWFGRAVFKDLGKNILYMPLFFNNEAQPFDFPFVIEKAGNKRVFECNKKNLINMKLLRKFPLISSGAMSSFNFKGSTIEGSNDYNFKRTEILHAINYFPFSTQQIYLIKPASIRYIRFKAPTGRKIKLAELEFYSDSCGIIKKLQDVSYKKEKTDYKENIYDGDTSTFCDTTNINIDFGSSKTISKIRFCSSNDSNYIIPGKKYELFYWDKLWVSAGQKFAKDYFLNYKNIPSGTIYWLRCLDEGKEERIFTYENGTQIWW